MRLDNGESHTARFLGTRRELIESGISSFGGGEIGCEGAIVAAVIAPCALGRVLIKPFCKPLADVRFAPKATELLQRLEMTRRARNRPRAVSKDVRSFALFEARQSKSLEVSLPIVGTNIRQFVVDPFQREMRQKPLL